MKKFLTVMLALFLMFSTVAFAEIPEIDYESLTLSELNHLIREANSAIDKYHSLPSGASSLLESKTKLAVNKLVPNLKSEPEYRLFYWTYSRDWNIYTVATEARINGSMETLNLTFNEEADGDFTLIYLKVGKTILLDNTALYPVGPNAAIATAAPAAAESDTSAPEVTAAPEIIIAQKGDKNDTVKDIQQMLIRLGYLTGTADGDYGNKTLTAVTDYQHTHGLEETGSVSATMYSAIKSEYDALPEEVHYESVTAKQLNDAFFDNEVAANQKYKGNIIDVSGKVESISQTWGTYYVRLAADAYGISTVSCSFSSTHENELASISKGTNVVIRGKCTGISFIEVYVEDCEIVG